MSFSIIQGNALEVLRRLPDDSIDMCVTSPPYWRLRSYQTEPQVWGGLPDCSHEWGPEQLRGGSKGGAGSSGLLSDRAAAKEGVRELREASEGCWCQSCGAWRGELGSEPTPELYVSHVVDVFREVRRVVRNTLWINIGDSYSGSGKSSGNAEFLGGEKQRTNTGSLVTSRTPVTDGLKPKDLVGIPWMLAFALRADGWYLRQEIIWEKPACMPESVKDRPTRSHEQLFLLAKSQKYYYDADAIKELGSPDTHARYARGRSNSHKYSDGGPGGQTIAKGFEHMREPGVNPKAAPAGSGVRNNESFSAAVKDIVPFRNKRSVWRVNSEPNSEETYRRVRVRVDAGSDGSERITSPNCPLHGDSTAPASSASCGGPQAGYQSGRIVHSGDRLSLEPQPATEPTEPLLGDCSPERTVDSQFRSDSDSAIPRNTETNKTDRARETTLACIASAENSCRTECTEDPCASSVLDANKRESNILGDSVSNALGSGPSERTDDGISRKCTCEYYIEKTEKVQHFAAFPMALVEPCIAAGSPLGGSVLDPFCGLGTVGNACLKLGRSFTGIELQPKYVDMAKARLLREMPLLAEGAAL